MKLITVFIFLTVIFNQVFAWDSSCTWDAQSLSDASQNLESAISEEKTNNINIANQTRPDPRSSA